ncbi:acyl-CoA dehydrogenase family protein [Actinoplanes sp. TBRC 11911]|uniref:acyl-CoA dehydrogenase family protein n=1 Tax=Actinoplanes sp. TBRC 11911 TaxID=2729386 RepID=UPI00145DA47D|nr:acyl-CoA dehydrogenase family protein [Actinoplanes sp. TBRC 11911]NMO53348.1 acyl-CoA dehydrogenase family protein [Actinoplanes sp. TBRC 11911]
MSDLDGPSCRATARRGDLATAFGRLHRTTEIPYGDRGHALVTEAVLRRCDPDAIELRRIVVESTVWVALRGPSDAPPAPLAWRRGLLWLRLGQSQWLLDQAVTYLSTRRSGDELLVNQQLVRADLADAATDHAVVEAYLDDPYATPDLHTVLTRTDRSLLRLLGGSGFLGDGPGQAAYLSELLADVYGGGPR